jgi:hypothetical protein
MLSRFAIAVLLAGAVSSTFSYAQGANYVVIGPGRDRLTLEACGAEGQAYFSRSSGDGSASPFSLVRFGRDGSQTNFALPETGQEPLVAEGNSGVTVLSTDFSSGEKRSIMYHFDSQGSLLAQHEIELGLRPSRMAVTASGKTILVGSWSQPAPPRTDPRSEPQAESQPASNSEPHVELKVSPAPQTQTKNGGVVLGPEDQVIKRFELPLPPEGGGWVFDSRRMLGEEDGAYITLYSYDPPATGLARISEDGEVEIKIIPNTPNNDERHHNQWIFGPDVAVEMYHYTDLRERCTFHFDEYDLKTGERTQSRYAFVSGGGFACYAGDEVSMLAHIRSEYPAQGLSSDTMRLVFGKLQDQPVSKPVLDPNACSCALSAEHCAAH